MNRTGLNHAKKQKVFIDPSGKQKFFITKQFLKPFSRTNLKRIFNNRTLNPKTYKSQERIGKPVREGLTNRSNQWEHNQNAGRLNFLLRRQKSKENEKEKKGESGSSLKRKLFSGSERLFKP